MDDLILDVSTPQGHKAMAARRERVAATMLAEFRRLRKRGRAALAMRKIHAATRRG